MRDRDNLSDLKWPDAACVAVGIAIDAMTRPVGDHTWMHLWDALIQQELDEERRRCHSANVMTPAGQRDATMAQGAIRVLERFRDIRGVLGSALERVRENNAEND
jgi:hypothetical protein